MVRPPLSLSRFGNYSEKVILHLSPKHITPYYKYEFIPGNFYISRDGWKEHGPIRYNYDNSYDMETLY